MNSDNGNERARKRAKARPGYHDPTAGIAGAAPTVSALSLRLVLAVFGMLACAALAIINHSLDGAPWLTIAAAVFAVVALIDIIVIMRRKRRGEPG